MTPVDGGEVQDILGQVRSQATRDGLAARLLLAALFRRLVVEQGGEVVVVGGTAVDTYVSGALGTSEELPALWEESRDIDTIALFPVGGFTRDGLAEVLVDHGFQASPTRCSFRHPKVPFALDIVNDHLEDDASRDHLVTVERPSWVEMELPGVLMIGPEDLLFDYLESAVDTRHQRDWVRAMAILQAMGPERLDVGYLYSKAHWQRDGVYVAWLEKLVAGEPLRVEDSR